MSWSDQTDAASFHSLQSFHKATVAKSMSTPNQCWQSHDGEIMTTLALSLLIFMSVLLISRISGKSYIRSPVQDRRKASESDPLLRSCREKNWWHFLFCLVANRSNWGGSHLWKMTLMTSR